MICKQTNEPRPSGECGPVVLVQWRRWSSAVVERLSVGRGQSDFMSTIHFLLSEHVLPTSRPFANNFSTTSPVDDNGRRLSAHNSLPPPTTFTRPIHHHRHVHAAHPNHRCQQWNWPSTHHVYLGSRSFRGVRGRLRRLGGRLKALRWS